MQTYFTRAATDAITITPVIIENFTTWLAQQAEQVKNWVSATNFIAKPDSFCLLPDTKGHLAQVVVILRNQGDFWPFGGLSSVLPTGDYKIDGVTDPEILQYYAIGWGLGNYQFKRYKQKQNNKTIAKLFVPQNCDLPHIENKIAAIFLVRDLINTPAEDMGPMQLAQAAVNVADACKAQVTQIIGDDLLKQNYPAIHAVGRASHQAPRLIDLQWGDPHAPKVTLVGKGVCFDSGGLDLKSASNMALMKKDMGGAAHALGLAQLIMQSKLPIRLRVLIPAVENAVSGNAYRPGDIINTRKGLTVEIGNTDAEGRLVLADALTEAVAEKPACIIDFSTLTGAARVAVGTEISAMFTDDETLAEQLSACAIREQDPVWRLPIYTPYRKLLDSSFADINNAGQSSYAGAITAALFLKEFVPAEIPWVHFDLMGWNISSRPGRPEGGEAMGLCAVFSYLQQRFANNK